MDVLSKDDVIAAIERKGPSRIPMHRMHYYNSATTEKYEKGIAFLRDAYPEDVVTLNYGRPDWESLGNTTLSDDDAIDSRVIIDSYNNVEEICEKIAGLAKHLDLSVAAAQRRENPDRYCLGYTWFALYERLWMLRGMENVLADFYENPQKIKMLMRAICDFHLAAIRAYGDMGCDGITISDDLGTQRTTVFGPQIFGEFYKPLYKELFDAAHDYGMHTWMHCCGHLAPILGDLVDTGLELIHPIQYSTYPGGTSANNPFEIVKEFDGKITFWAGIDVQYLLPRGTEDEVRAGVRELIDLFDGEKGGLVIACGNGILPETPFENIEAFFEESLTYGITKRQRANI